MLVSCLLASSLLVAQPASAAPNTLDLSEPPPLPWTHEPGDPETDGFANGTWVTDLQPGPVQYFPTHTLPYPHGEWNAMVQSTKGWAIETRLRVDPVSGDRDCSRANIWANDLTNLLVLGFGGRGVCLLHPTFVEVPFPTTDAFHTYRFEVTGQTLVFRIDGQERARAVIPPGGTGSRLLGFGDFGEFRVGTGRLKIAWDSFTYDVSVGGPACTIVGTAGPDTLTGTSGADNICAGRGNDVVRAGDGDDSLVGFLGRDQLFGGAGDDSLFGGNGDDALSGGTGTDRCFGGAGVDSGSGCESSSRIP